MDGFIPGLYGGAGEVSSFFFVSSFHRLSIDAGGRLFLPAEKHRRGKVSLGSCFSFCWEAKGT